ncbi:hypothetical protein JB92DRAFT_2833698 [Gautieria morchelliformis]|nr:hypothetical protein JB92DRAFT_2833698 [Gautieria morchelliformis]
MGHLNQKPMMDALDPFSHPCPHDPTVDAMKKLSSAQHVVLEPARLLAKKSTEVIIGVPGLGAMEIFYPITSTDHARVEPHKLARHLSQLDITLHCLCVLVAQTAEDDLSCVLRFKTTVGGLTTSSCHCCKLHVNWTCKYMSAQQTWDFSDPQWAALDFVYCIEQQSSRTQPAEVGAVRRQHKATVRMRPPYPPPMSMQDDQGEHYLTLLPTPSTSSVEAYRMSSDRIPWKSVKPASHNASSPSPGPSTPATPIAQVDYQSLETLSEPWHYSDKTLSERLAWTSWVDHQFYEGLSEIGVGRSHPVNYELYKTQSEVWHNSHNTLSGCRRNLVNYNFYKTQSDVWHDTHNTLLGCQRNPVNYNFYKTQSDGWHDSHNTLSGCRSHPVNYNFYKTQSDGWHDSHNTLSGCRSRPVNYEFYETQSDVWHNSHNTLSGCRRNPVNYEFYETQSDVWHDSHNTLSGCRRNPVNYDFYKTKFQMVLEPSGPL